LHKKKYIAFNILKPNSENYATFKCYLFFWKIYRFIKSDWTQTFRASSPDKYPLRPKLMVVVSVHVTNLTEFVKIRATLVFPNKFIKN
jgi:hypothetical protein